MPMKGAPMHRFSSYLTLATLLAVANTGPYAYADEAGGQRGAGHRSVTGTVIEKGGGLVVQTPDGSTYQLNPAQSARHGHAAPKAGDEVTVVFDENNLISEIHPKGEGGAH